MQLATRASRARRAVMSVGNIQRRNAGKRRHEPGNLTAARPPQRMAHTVDRLEVEKRRARGRLPRDRVDGARGSIGQEDGARLRAQRQQVPRAIVFLVGPRPLVLLDEIPVVLVEGVAGRDADLFVRSHPEPVEIDGRLFLDDERRVPLQRLEVSDRGLVDDRRVRIGGRRQIDLGARDMEKAAAARRPPAPRLPRD